MVTIERATSVHKIGNIRFFDINEIRILNRQPVLFDCILTIYYPSDSLKIFSCFSPFSRVQIFLESNFSRFSRFDLQRKIRYNKKERITINTKKNLVFVVRKNFRDMRGFEITRSEKFRRNRRRSRYD